jgi:hypothetical protein
LTEDAHSFSFLDEKLAFKHTLSLDNLIFPQDMDLGFSALRWNLLEQGVDERCQGTGLGKDDQGSQKDEHKDYREQPVSLSHLQKLAEFSNNRLFRHGLLLSIVLKTAPWAVWVPLEPPSMKKPLCLASPAVDVH